MQQGSSKRPPRIPPDVQAQLVEDQYGQQMAGVREDDGDQSLNVSTGVGGSEQAEPRDP